MSKLNTTPAEEAVVIVESEESQETPDQDIESLRQGTVDKTHVIVSKDFEGNVRTRVMEGMYGIVPPYGE